MEKKQQHATYTHKFLPLRKNEAPKRRTRKISNVPNANKQKAKGPKNTIKSSGKTARERERDNPTFDFLHLKKGNLHQKLITCQQVSAIHSFSVIIKSEHVNAMTLPCTIFGSGFRPSLSSLSLSLSVSLCMCVIVLEPFVLKT
jgi:tRNA(Met) C34 N-acetyltransferase TmcA